MLTTKIAGNVDKPIPELRGKLGAVKFPAFGEIKYDGEFTFIFYEGNKICTVNKYNKLRTQYPNLTLIRDELFDCGVASSATMIAELYYGDGKRNALYDLNSNKESNDLNLKIFDLLELDGNDITGDQLVDRKEALQDIFPCNTSFLAKTKVIKDKVGAEEYFKWTTDNGYEGAVIKSLDSALIAGPCSWVKMKFKDQSDYEVHLIDPTKERIEVLVPIAQTHPSGTQQKFVRVGVKAASRYKRFIRVNDKVTVEHQGVLDSGSLRHPVLIPKKEWL